MYSDYLALNELVSSVTIAYFLSDFYSAIKQPSPNIPLFSE